MVELGWTTSRRWEMENKGGELSENGSIIVRQARGGCEEGREEEK